MKQVFVVALDQGAVELLTSAQGEQLSLHAQKDLQRHDGRHHQPEKRQQGCVATR